MFLSISLSASVRALRFPYVFRTMSSSIQTKGLLLGVFEKNSNELEFTQQTADFDHLFQGRLTQLVKSPGLTFKKGKSRLLYGINETYPCVSVVNLGPAKAGFSEIDEIDEKRENIRTAIAVGARQLREVGVTSIDVDSCGDATAAAEGGTLGLFSYDELKKKAYQKPNVTLNCLDKDEGRLRDWEEGVIRANGQNLARTLTESPANVMTPTRFAEVASNTLKNVEVIVRDKAWAESQKMGSFLSVTQGSDQPPVFLEVHYKGGNPTTKPLVMVGKGITFDSGGISLKPSSNMDKMRGDMGGAASIIGAIYTISTLKVPVNVIGLIPLCENLINGHATKPGDVVTAMNGKTIQVDNTDAEGRLILADALCYAHTFNPQTIIDLATLTGAMMVALGTGATGVFTNSSKVWGQLEKAGRSSGDRVWRMPLFSHYTRQVIDSHLADVSNIGKYGRDGGACVAAAFLKEFVTAEHWAHLDIAGVMEVKDEIPYLPKGMSGRPTRTLVDFAKQYSDQVN